MGFWTRRRGSGRRDDASDTPAQTSSTPESAQAPVAPPSSIPTPVTRERIAAWFTEHGFHYFVDSDNDLGGHWHTRVFFFFLLGEHEEILQIRSQWNREVSIERIDEVLTFCNKWNFERVWPKTYIRVRDNGMIQVCADTVVDLEQGINNEQLSVQLVCGLNSQTLFWNAVDDLYPDPAARAA